MLSWSLWSICHIFSLSLLSNRAMHLPWDYSKSNCVRRYIAPLLLCTSLNSWPVPQIQQQTSLIKEKSETIRLQQIQLEEQQAKIQEQANKMAEHEATISEVKKNIEEWDQKFSDLVSEVIRAKEDILSKTATSPLDVTRQLLHSNIKPRTAKVIPTPSFLELERKRKLESKSEVPSKLSRSTAEITITTNNISKNVTRSSARVASRKELGPLFTTFDMILTPSATRKRKMTDGRTEIAKSSKQV